MYEFFFIETQDCGLFSCSFHWKYSSKQKGIFKVTNHVSDPIVSFLEIKEKIEGNSTIDLELYINNIPSCRIAGISFSGVS